MVVVLTVMTKTRGLYKEEEDEMEKKKKKGKLFDDNTADIVITYF